MPEYRANLLLNAAPMHDVGKIGVPDHILQKNGPLTPEEWLIVKKHPLIGAGIIGRHDNELLEMARVIALTHHEKWDGSGYPRGLHGETIPVEGRIVAIADVFDALTSDRVYRRAFSVEKAVEMMLEERTRHFDPVLLDAFMEVLGRSGPDARAQIKSNPQALLAQVRETYVRALARGDAESAEGTIAQAIEDGLTPSTLHVEVIERALAHVNELRETGELDHDGEREALVITRRILATLHRYMLGGTDPGRDLVIERLEGCVHSLQERLDAREHALG
jgi:CheY-like chemotaxis protein